MNPILVTGGNGQLGRQLRIELGERAVALGHSELDVTSVRSIEDAFREHSPRAVINCAAYTAVDQAESDQERCRELNAGAVATLASHCEAASIPLVQISTDYVFGDDPPERRPRLETDPVTPLSVYAKTKHEGEIAARHCSRHFVVRTCGLYDPLSRKGTANFVKTMVRLGRERDELKVVADQFCTPTSVVDLARALAFLVETEHYGTYHVTNSGGTCWHDFAAHIFELASIGVQLRTTTTAEFGAPATRPCYSVLDIAKYESLGGPSMPSWQDALAACLES